MTPRQANRIRKAELEAEYGMSLEEIYKELGKTYNHYALNKKLGLTQKSFMCYRKYCVKGVQDVEPVYANTTIQEEREFIIGKLAVNRRTLIIRKREEYELIRRGNSFELVRPEPYPVEYYLARLEERFNGRRNLIAFIESYTERFVQLHAIARELWIPHQHKTAELLWRLGFKEYVKLKGSLHIENWNSSFERRATSKLKTKSKEGGNGLNEDKDMCQGTIVKRVFRKPKLKEHNDEERKNLFNSLMSINFINSFNCKKFGLKKLRDNFNTENNLLDKIKKEKAA